MSSRTSSSRKPSTLSSHLLHGRVERRLKSRSHKSSIRNNSATQNNSKRPLISRDVINQMNILLNIHTSDFNTPNLVRKLNYIQVKTLASLLIESTKLGMIHKLTKKKTNISDPKSVRELLKVISLIDPSDTNKIHYHVYINYIQTILNNENNYTPKVLDTFPVYKTLVLNINQNITSQEKEDAAALMAERAIAESNRTRASESNA
jgi:hypothetical protein